jgi:hypothetical protein
MGWDVPEAQGVVGLVKRMLSVAQTGHLSRNGDAMFEATIALALAGTTLRPPAMLHKARPLKIFQLRQETHR